MKRLIAWISDLRVAIGLLIVIAACSGLGTLVPQKESAELYHRVFDAEPWLGLFNGEQILALQLDHVYSSSWFLALLAWLGLALILCSWRRQWPALQAALRWIDYQTPRQLSKLTLAETVVCDDPSARLQRLDALLAAKGWQLQRHPDRLSARRGVSGRVGPLLVHAGLVVLMVGAAWGSLGGQRLERYLAPGNELELLNSRGESQVTVTLKRFGVERDPAGRPEQFRSLLRLDPGSAAQAETHEISVNHPLRYRGMTLYQADWSLAAVQVQLGKSPILELPLQSFPQLGEQVWGIVLPTRPDGSNPVLLALSSEQGPITVYSADAEVLGSLIPGAEATEIEGIPLKVAGVIPASGILLKRDPGVPLVYGGFGIALLGGALSLIATRQLWAIAEPSAQKLHVGGLCNRNLTALALELPGLLAAVGSADQQA
ncbi:cytochrome c biogenesis protein ResB [Vulcanococcus sp.]|jgi:cytochrome c biogenesis protein|uniref:cytochrome c biogenesis protein ResB n=2 Tax=Vulcanococcus sp. TaxID=2856995 RepID=UPI003C0EE984